MIIVPLTHTTQHQKSIDGWYYRQRFPRPDLSSTAVTPHKSRCIKHFRSYELRLQAQETILFHANVGPFLADAARAKSK